MDDKPQSAQPGWYPTPEGGQRYWNGENWLDLPDPAAAVNDAPESPRWRPSKKVIIIAAAVLVVLGIAGTTAKMVADSNARSEQEAAVAAANEAAQQEADRIATAAAAAAEEQESKDAGERLSRILSVSQIETSVKTMAEDHAAKGTVTGPIISVSCSPVSGGSTDDLTETTTAFDCFAANKDNGDGTMRGYNYHATMNWSTGSFTYGFGTR